MAFGFGGANPGSKSRVDFRGPKRGKTGQSGSGIAHQPASYPNTASFASSSIPKKRKKR